LFVDDNTDNLRQLFYIDCITLKKLSEIVIIVVYHPAYQPIDCLSTTIQTILDYYYYIDCVTLKKLSEIVIIVVYHPAYQPIDCLLTTIQTILDNYFISIA